MGDDDWLLLDLGMGSHLEPGSSGETGINYKQCIEDIYKEYIVTRWWQNIGL